MTKVAEFFRDLMANSYTDHHGYVATDVLETRRPSGDNMSTEELKIKLDNAYKFRI